jgi:DnaJ-class molecular chaperone
MTRFNKIQIDSHKPNKEFEIDITVEEALNGYEFDIGYERILIDKKCKLVTCKDCGGNKVIMAQQNKNGIRQITTIPCPRCSGHGKHPNDCNPYYTTEHRMKVSIPAGAQKGDVVKFEGYGNEVYIDNQPKLGDFVVTIEGVSSGNFSMKDSKLMLTVTMTPEEALEGFQRTERFIDGRSVAIDRTNKVTLPETEVTIENFQNTLRKRKDTKLKEASVGADGEVEDDVSSARLSNFDDLLIHFDVTSEEDDEVKNLPQGELSNNDTVDDYLAKGQFLLKRKRSRDILRMLSKAKEVKENSQ